MITNCCVQLRHRHDAVRRHSIWKKALTTRSFGEAPLVIGEIRRGSGGVVVHG